MSRVNLRKKINGLGANPDLVLLEKYGVVSEFGNITALGRRIQSDLQFNGKKGTMAEIVASVKAVEAAEAPVTA